MIQARYQPILCTFVLIKLNRSSACNEPPSIAANETVMMESNTPNKTNHAQKLKFLNSISLS